MQRQALVIGSDPETRATVEEALRTRGFYPIGTSFDALEPALDGTSFDVLLLHCRADDEPGVACRRVRDVCGPTRPLVLLDAAPETERIRAAMPYRPAEVLAPPFAAQDIARAAEGARASFVLQRTLGRLEHGITKTGPFPELIGESAAMRKVQLLLHRVRLSQATVLITGPSGSGKEVVAEALHVHGPRSRGPFVPINCAAIPEHLLESELFGHAKGAFTDATRSRKGLLQQADKGTVFLDEIGAMPVSLQSKLLRALQERTVRPLGEAHEVPFDVRVIAATNTDLGQDVAAGRFRADLYFRLNVIHIALPPLAERGHDVLLLAWHFLQRSAPKTGKHIRTITPAAARCLLRYDWPGNVRELENSIETAVVAARHDAILDRDLPSRIRTTPSGRARTKPISLVPLDALESAHLAQVLREAGGNKSLASKVLGVDRKTLYRKLRRYSLQDAT